LKTLTIYLDNAATTRLDIKSLDCLFNIHKEKYGNPSSLHMLGVEAENIYRTSIKKISELINANLSNVIITSGGTESNNTGLWQIKKFKNSKNKILTCKLEHPSVLKYCDFLKFRESIDYSYYQINEDGSINIEDLKNKIDDAIGLITIPLINSEVGFVQDIEKISKIIKKIDKDILIHVDGVQAFGKIKIDVDTLNIDTMSFSSHKIHGPKGLGGLYIKEPNKFIPMIYGGGQQNHLRSGTENTPGIAAFAKTCEIAQKNIKVDYKKISKINNKYRNLLKKNIDDIIFNSKKDNSSPYILSLSIKDIKSEVLIHFLEMDEIYISSGSACSSNYKGMSSSYEVLKIPKDYVEGTIRISFGRFSKEEDTEYVVKKINKYVKKIRKIMRS